MHEAGEQRADCRIESGRLGREPLGEQGLLHLKMFQAAPGCAQAIDLVAIAQRARLLIDFFQPAMVLLQGRALLVDLPGSLQALLSLRVALVGNSEQAADPATGKTGGMQAILFLIQSPQRGLVVAPESGQPADVQAHVGGEAFSARPGMTAAAQVALGQGGGAAVVHPVVEDEQRGCPRGYFGKLLQGRERHSSLAGCPVHPVQAGEGQLGAGLLFARG
ncbi:hypothetical protein D3C81_1634380 [compost metagenome]